MRPSLRTCLTLASMTALAPQALAQFGPLVRRGPTSNLAAGISLGAPLGLPLPYERANLAKAPGDQATAPLPWSRSQFPAGPDFSLGAMFPGFADKVEIRAHSTGSEIIPDLIPEPGPPLLDMSSGLWMGVTVSVSNDSDGVANGLVAQRRALPTGRTGPGSDLISYYLRGSQGIDASLVGATVLSQPAEAISFGDATDTRDIDALDFGLGVISYARGGSSTLFFRNSKAYYFTLTPASAAEINDYFTNFGTLSWPKFAFGVPGFVEADAQTIYHLEWSTSGWGIPRVYRTPGQLDLDEGDYVDAIAVDPNTGVTIFSTQPKVGRSQLLVHSDNQGRVVSLQDTGGPVAQRFVKKTTSTDDKEDIDAVCTTEPEPLNFGSHLGTPLTSIAHSSPGDAMGMSVTRLRTQTDEDQFHLQVSGWGQTSPAVGVVHFYSVDPLNPQPGTSVYITSRLRLGLADRVVEHLHPAPQPPAALPNGTLPPPGTLGFAALFCDFNGNVLATSLVSVVDEY